ncbi:uncharacterized protein J7T54_004680 [Emericellopsis cladophorae]|uniref:DUF7136 domain-containing protein n=1 Tax=Emericellopsis cladophorae TaxID=2686198 RepID=A0A9P9Y5Y0_9HYPO|nr:uncharacterized protein J7T54_004680 [Emericellopsis cladophorae]KAI6784134.1 hypothetical protein J7T54_004680 [Emericellopsis cladophorae]
MDRIMGQRLVAWMCLLGGSLTMGADTDFETGINEFTSIFPRNETYAPSYLSPFVFAFQNPAATRSVNFSIRINLMKWNESASDWDVIGATAVDTEKLANASDSKPFFAHHVYGDTFNTEAYWTFSWNVYWPYCIQEEYLPLLFSGKFYMESRGHVWNLTEVVSGYDVDLSACAFFSNMTPTPRLCEAQVDSELVESIYASATARVCRWDDSMIKCPADESDDEDTGLLALAAICLKASTALAVPTLLARNAHRDSVSLLGEMFAGEESAGGKPLGNVEVVERGDTVEVVEPPAAGGDEDVVEAGEASENEEGAFEYKVEIEALFGDSVALESGDLKQGDAYPPAPLGLEHFENVIWTVELADGTEGSTLQKINYMLNAEVLSISARAKLAAEANTFVIDPAIGELEFEVEENELAPNER